MKKARLSAGKVTELPLKMLHPDPDQPRRGFDVASLKELADNIRSRKVQQPILVRMGEVKGKSAIIIKDGERRWRAAALAKLKTVPVLLVDGKQDAVQTQLDQVAVNNLREGLRPMEIARFLVKLRDDHKLSPNQIAERLEKDGLKAMSRSQVSNLMRLVNLEPWAQKLLDDGAVDASAARSILAAADLPAAMKVVRDDVERQVNWKGRVTVSEIDRAVIGGYDHAAIDLERTHSYDGSKPVAHFDHRKVCQGCEHLKRIGNRAFCLNAEKFKEKNDQAIAAGLQPGGKKPERAAAGRKPTAAQARSQEKAKEERREQTAETRMANYLDAWLRPQIKACLALAAQTDTVRQLVAWLASGRPDPGLSDNNYIPAWKSAGATERATGRPRSLPAFLTAPITAADELALARGCVNLMGQAQIRELAQHIGIHLQKDWVADAAFLKLRTKAQLLAWARGSGLVTDDVKNLKGEELRQILLAEPAALKFDGERNLAHEALLAAYTALIERDDPSEYDDEQDDVDPAGFADDDTGEDDE